MVWLVLVTLSLGALKISNAFYLPGVNPKSYDEGEVVKLKVNKLTSTKTLLPLDYYVLPYCAPIEGTLIENDNLGELLAGDRIESSPYRLEMKKDMFCEQLCIANLGHGEQPNTPLNKFVKAIRKNYHNNWIVDNLSSASKAENINYTTTQYFQGFPIGYISKEDNLAYVHNHVNLEIEYHQIESDPRKYRVVGFMVEHFSIGHTFEPIKSNDVGMDFNDEHVLPSAAKISNPILSCLPKSKNHTSYDVIAAAGIKPQLASNYVLFTYDVIWKPSNITWASRWDVYLNIKGQARVHWISIGNSMVIVIVLSAMIVTVLIRNLRRDINRYNKVATDEESRAEELEEFGWKLVHADVFRPPCFSPMLLCICCGTGAQLLCMSFFTIIFSAMGFMSPARRGHLLMGALLLFVTLGSVNGYVTARLYKTFKGKSWHHVTLLTSIAFPGVAFGIFFLLDLVAWANNSTDAVPFVTILILLVLWFGISTPLVFVGAYIGFKQEAIEFPVNTSSIPRQIPDQPWFMFAPFTLLIGGILPFGACFVELFFIMGSAWMEFYYYVFGFLFLVFIILLVTCAEITTLFTYFQLCSEDYHWWWRSFANAGAAAFYVFAYSIVYFQQLEANQLSTYILYFGYMALSSLALFLLMGSVGVASSLWFNKIIFASIKID